MKIVSLNVALFKGFVEKLNSAEPERSSQVVLNSVCECYHLLYMVKQNLKEVIMILSLFQIMSFWLRNHFPSKSLFKRITVVFNHGINQYKHDSYCFCLKYVLKACKSSVFFLAMVKWMISH